METNLNGGAYSLKRFILNALLATFISVQLYGQETSAVVNDVTQLNPIKVKTAILMCKTLKLRDFTLLPPGATITIDMRSCSITILL